MKKLILTAFNAFCLIILSVSVSLSQNLQISGGNNFSSVVCNQQVVNVTGYNVDGQLGVDAAGIPLGTGLFRSSWAPVSMGNLGTVSTATAPSVMPAIRQADAGSGGHLLGLDCNKNVWAWGLNDAGQLGRNALVLTFAQQSVPMRVLKGAQTIAGSFLGNVDYVSGGNNSSFAIEATTGKVLSWGSNDYGQLGDGTVITRLTPVYVMISAGVPLTNIVQIEAGDDCSYALDASGQMWSWGITNDGINPARNLGRTLTGQITGAAGGGTLCMPYAGKVERGTNDNNSATTNGFLDDIVSISGGDAHALGLDGNGQVWSMGGDWAVGQIGQGNGGQYNYKAGRVVDIGVTSPTGPFLGGGTSNPYKAISIAGGQSSCSIVLKDTTDPTNANKNRVVVFGTNDFYSFNSMVTQPSGTITFAGNMRFQSGTLGRGTCNGVTALAQGTQNENTDATSYEYPVFVETAAGVPLTGVTTVSDGDAWYFATNDVGGNAVSWGWNRRGEQATGTFNDRCYATSLTLPTSCSFDYPCPGQPILPADFATCPIFTRLLDSQVPQDYATYKYNWQYRATPGSGTWTDIAAEGTTSGTLKTTIVTSTNDITYTASQLGEFRVLLSDTRASVAFLCAPCPVLKDSITITAVPNPYTFTGCTGAVNSTYTVSGPASAKIKWYTAASGGSALNPLDSNTSITVPNATAPLTAACGAGNRALFADDVGSSQGILRPGTTVATAPNAGVGNTEDGQRSPLEIQATKTLTITEVSIVQPSQSYNYSSDYTVEIYSDNTVSGPDNCGACTPSNSKYGPSVAPVYSAPLVTIPYTGGSGYLVRQLSLNATLPAGKYWIQVKSTSSGIVNFSNTPATNTAGSEPVWNAIQTSTGAVGLNGLLATHDGSPGLNSHLFNIKFQTGTGYTCGRILVCQNSTACPLPVNLLYFNAKKAGALAELSWATASELNSSYFIVQRSTDAIQWSNIGKVKAKGTSNSLAEYNYTDSNLPIGTVYYRVVEVDIDGATQNSDVESINTTGNLEIAVVPNPNNGNFNITIQGGTENAVLTITNTLGQVVYERSEDISNNFTKEINASYLSKGVYYLTVKNSKEYKTTRIILE